MSTTRRWSFAALALGCALVASCGDPNPEASGNSNWLKACTSDAECGSGLTCACSVCTKPCDQSLECSSVAATSGCFDPAAGPANDQCAAELSAGHAGICLKACGGNDDCEGQICEGGGCIGPVNTGQPNTMTDVHTFVSPFDAPAPSTSSCEGGLLFFDSGTDDGSMMAMATVGDTLLIAGQEDYDDTPERQTALRIERRALSDLSFVDGFGAGGALTGDPALRARTPLAIVADADFLYTAAMVSSDGRGELRLEKRNVEDGALDIMFGADGEILAEEFEVASGSDPFRPGLLVDGSTLYTTGGSTFAVTRRNAEDGAPIIGFGESGIVESEAPTLSQAQALALRDGVLYVGGSDGKSGLRLEARDAETGELLYERVEERRDGGCGREGFKAILATEDSLFLAGAVRNQWLVERRDRSNGDLVFRHEVPGTGNCDAALAIALDDSGLYVTGRQGAWRIEKRSLVDGELLQGFGRNGLVEQEGDFPIEEAHALVLRDGVLHVAGSGRARFWSGSDWRVERRSSADGSLLDCPPDLSQVPAPLTCAATPTVEESEAPEEAGCDVRTASSNPCEALSLRASLDSTPNEVWWFHYPEDREDWGLATAGLTSLPTDYFVARGFGFALPDGAELLGIGLEVERELSSGMVEDYAVRLVRGDRILDGDRSLPGLWDDGITQVDYGGPSDLWDAAWTAAEINDPTFGVAMRMAPLIDNSSVQIEALRLRVYYCEP